VEWGQVQSYAYLGHDEADDARIQSSQNVRSP
jgi:hypothetical protein